jgi:hypothetical protein
MNRLALCGVTMVALGATLQWRTTEARGQEARSRETRVQKSFPSGGIRQVKASVKIGSIRLVADSRDEIRVTAVRKVKEGASTEAVRWMEQSRVELDQQGSAIVLNDIVPERQRSSGSKGSAPRLDVEFHVPPGLAVESSTNIGDTDISGRLGDLSLQSGVGNIKLRQLECAGGIVNAKSGVGDVEMALRSLPDQRIKLEVGVGKVRVGLSSGARARLNTTTGVGQIASSFPTAQARRGGLNLGGTASGELNGGGIPIDINIGVGDLRLDREN